MSHYKINEDEKKTILAVFGELLNSPYKDLNRLGDLTINRMQKLYRKLKYHDYCKRHGIRYEEMTAEDVMREYEEREEGENENGLGNY